MWLISNSLQTITLHSDILLRASCCSRTARLDLRGSPCYLLKIGFALSHWRLRLQKFVESCSCESGGDSDSSLRIGSSDISSRIDDCDSSSILIHCHNESCWRDRDGVFAVDRRCIESSVSPSSSPSAGIFSRRSSHILFLSSSEPVHVSRILPYSVVSDEMQRENGKSL